MIESNPLVGLTAEEADAAIERLAAKIREQKDSLKVAEAHLKDLKAARKGLQDPEPPGNGVVVTAQTAEVGVEAPEVGS